MDKKQIILDLTDCKYLMELHERIKTAFGFPDWYGKNFDAFYDLLRSECSAEKLMIKGFYTVNKELAPSLKIMADILERFSEERYVQSREYNDILPFDYEIE